MPEQTITCPNCGEKIALTDALMHPFEEKIRKKVEANIHKKEEEIAKREKELEKSEKKIKKQLAQELKKAKAKIEKEAKKGAEEALRVELNDLQEQIKEKDEKLQEAQEQELELRKQRRELEESKKSFEIEMARKLDEERKEIEERAIKSAEEEHRLKDLEREKQNNDLKKQIIELKRKIEQGSQQLQGEVFELDLENLLKANFPNDLIEPVPTGMKGADILQRVNAVSGRCCGIIIWESKRTKRWNDGWIKKLKNDQRSVNAEIAAIVTTTMPKDVINFGVRDGVLVANHQSVIPVTTILRTHLMELARTKQLNVSKNEKIEILFNYLTGPRFRQKVEAFAEALIGMKIDLDREKIAMNKIWAKREQQMVHALYSIATMYGDMQGIIGASLPEIKSLALKELPSLESIEEK